MPTDVTPEDVEKFRRIASSLSPADRAAIFGPASAPRTQGHKMTPVLDALSDGDVARVVHACRAGMKRAIDAGGTAEADAEALDEVARVSPAAAAVMRANSDYRRKPYAHSLQAASNYLQSETFHAKREAAKRAVPPAEPPRAAAPADPKVGK
jgi:hypothetical protein